MNDVRISRGGDVSNAPAEALLVRTVSINAGVAVRIVFESVIYTVSQNNVPFYIYSSLVTINGNIKRKKQELN